MTSRTVQSNPTSFTYFGNEMLTAGGINLSYDENGNLTAAPKDASTSMTLAYNWDNKLRKATIGSDEISLKYDPAGNRIQKNSSAAGNRKYIVDVVGDLPVILLELEPVPGYSFEVTKAYIYANSQILAQNDNTGKYFYLHDRLGSVRQVINSSSSPSGVPRTVVKMFTYNPFGETIEEQGTVDNNFKFTGQWYDEETGQYYLRNRQYSSYLGRFTSYDRVAGEFENPLTWHRYLYCFNNPINMIDPWGLDAYLIYLPQGGPDWLAELLGENPGHIEIAVDIGDGKVMVGSAGYGNVFKPSDSKTLEEVLGRLKKTYGDEVKVMRFKNKTLDATKGITSDQRIYDYINNGLGKDMYWPWCSRFSQQALAYGGYQLGVVNGLTSSWLWGAAESWDEYSDDVSPYSK